MKNEEGELAMLSSESDIEVEEELPEILEEEPTPRSPAATIIGMPLSGNSSSRKRLLMKQLSMRETSREAKWEKRRRQILQRRKMMVMMEEVHEADSEVVMDRDGGHAKLRSLTDEDLDELRGSIELGFGFEEENGGHSLCDTLPALDLYFAVNRQFSDSKLQYSPSPTATSSSSTLCGTPSPRSPQHRHSTSSDSWTIFSPGSCICMNACMHSLTHTLQLTMACTYNMTMMIIIIIIIVIFITFKQGIIRST